MKTCQKLSVSFWDYLGARLAIPEQLAIRTSPPTRPKSVQARLSRYRVLPTVRRHVNPTSNSDLRTAKTGLMPR